MKKFGLTLLFAIITLALTATSSFAQYKEIEDNGNFSGPVIKEQQPSAGDWSNLFNMQMSHSYSMSFMSFGGQYRNVNAYTNSMDFFFTDRLTGELDISLMHSPFGQGFSGNNQMGMGADIIIRNASLNYQLGEKSHISIEFQQRPYGGYGAFGGNPYNPFGYSRH